jgi:hypothetical protein
VGSALSSLGWVSVAGEMGRGVGVLPSPADARRGGCRS